MGSKMFGAAEPADAGGAEPADHGNDPSVNPPDGDTGGTQPSGNGQGADPGGQGQDGKGQQGQTDDPLSKFSTNEEVAEYIRSLEGRVVAMGEQLRETVKSQNTQQFSQGQQQTQQPAQPAQPAVDPTDQKIAQIYEKIKEQTGPEEAEWIRDLSLLVASKVAKSQVEPLRNQISEFQLDTQMEKVRSMWPDVDNHLDILIQKSRQPGYENVKIEDLCRIVLGPPSAGQFQGLGNLPHPTMQQRNPQGQDINSFKRNAHIDGGGGSGALPDKAPDSASATQLLERTLFGEQGSQDSVQKNFFGVR